MPFWFPGIGVAHDDGAGLTGGPPQLSAATLSPASPRVGDVVVATAATTGWPSPALAYQWMLDGAPLPEATDAQIGAPGPGALSCRVTARNGSGEATALAGPVVVGPALVAPAFDRAPAIDAALVTVGDRVMLDEGVATGVPAPTLSGALWLDDVDVTARMDGLSYVAEATGALTWRVRAENALGAVEENANAVVVARPPSTATTPRVVGSAFRQEWGASGGAATISVEREEGATGLIAVAMVLIRDNGDRLPSGLDAGGAAGTCLTPSDGFGGNNRISAWTAPVPDGTGPATVTITRATGAPGTAAIAVWLVENAVASAYHAVATVPDAAGMTGESAALIDAPDSGLVLSAAFTTGAPEVEALGVAADYLQPGWVAGHRGRETRFPGLPVGARYLTTATNRAMCGVALASPGSVEKIRPTLTPLVAHGRGGARTVYVGHAAQIDLREFHHGYDGALSYAVTAGTLPAGLSLVGGFIEGAPTTVAAETTVSVTVTRGAESVALSVPITVAAAAASGDIASGASIATAPGGDHSFTASSGVYTLDYGAPVVDADRFGSIALTGLTPGVAYEFIARVKYTHGGADDSPAMLRIVHTDDAHDYGGNNSTSIVEDDNADAWHSVIAKQPMTPGASGVEVTRVVRLVFVPGRATVYAQIGKFSYVDFDSGSWRAKGPFGVGNDTYVLDSLLLREADDQLAPGAVANVDRYREGHAVFVFDKPRTVRRHISGMGATLVSPEADPVRVEAIWPPFATQGGRDAQVYDQHGAAWNWGASVSGFGALGQPFDPRATANPSSPILRYEQSLNIDPGRLGGPIVLKAGVGEGDIGSLTKGYVRPDNYAMLQQQRGNIWATHSLTVRRTDPGAEAFMPPTPVPAATHKTLSDLITDWEDIVVHIDKPATAPAINFDEVMFYLSGEGAPAQGMQNTPDMRNSAYLHRRDYGREQSRRWDQVLLALLTTPDTTGALTSAQWGQVARRALQHGIAVDGMAQAGPWIGNGGGSQNFKPFATFAAMAFNDAAMKERLDGQRAVKPYADDRFISYVPASIIAPTYYPPDYESPNTKRPRSPYAPEMLGMPEWRNEEKSGSNYFGEGYRYISVMSSLGGYLFAHRLVNGTETALTLWNNDVTWRYIDRHFGWSRRPPTQGESPVAGLVAYWQAGRAQGKPVAMNRNGLVETGSVGAGSATDHTGRVWPSANANPSAGARDIPLMRSWPEGAATTLDLAAEEFNAYAGLLDGAPTSYAIIGAEDAAGDAITPPAWASVNSSGVLTVTPDDTALRFLLVRGSNSAGAATARVAVRGG